jgi:hypothetical protein
MGGRGAAKPGALLLALWPDLPDPAEWGYNVVTHNDPAHYPFLERLDRPWTLITHPVAGEVVPHPAHTFGQTEPTLRWVNGEQINDLYVAQADASSADTDAFFAATGLDLSLHKGGFVLSKRLSRILRPYRASGFYDDVAIAYMEQDEDAAKVWDGAGLISHAMLERIGIDPNLTPEKQAHLRNELRHTHRVEFTVMTANGQDKGHAIVAEKLFDGAGNPVDFLLPEDTKREVRLTGDHAFVGVAPVHGKQQMRLDIQSLINLYPFFTEDQLLSWLDDEGQLFQEGITTGTVGALMGRIDGNTPLADVKAWPLREYLASGGHPLWFAGHTRSLFNQHLQRLNASTLEKLRLPIPGARHYVMPAAVGRRAGLEIIVDRGQIQIDAQAGTAWVNDDDWIELQDGQDGIAGILGGADNDDALWLFPFTDHDGSHKTLAWRSPNQSGEYVVLEPTTNSDIAGWNTSTPLSASTSAGLSTSTSTVLSSVEVNEPSTFPVADSRNLPPRVDHVQTEYLNLVVEDPDQASRVGQDYSVAAMDDAIARAQANQGALGMTCNTLMLDKAIFGRLPTNPPAPLEDVIDASVKTGADLSAVVGWNYAHSRELLETGVPIPSLLHNRLSIERDLPPEERPPERPPRPRFTSDHWLDRLEDGIRSHIEKIRAIRDKTSASARPPDALFDAAFADAEALQLGRALNSHVAAALKMETLSPTQYDRVRDELPDPTHEKPLERARRSAEDFLARFHPDRHSAILRGALSAAYIGETPTSDVAAWLQGSKPATGRTIGIGNQTIDALREIGLLDELGEIDGRLLSYPRAEIRHPHY